MSKLRPVPVPEDGRRMADIELPPMPPPAPPQLTAVARHEPLAEQLSRGRPRHFPTPWHWAAAGIGRQWPAAFVALVLAWSGVWLLLAGAALLVVIAIVTAIVASFITGGIGGLFGIVIAAVTIFIAVWNTVVVLLTDGPSLIIGALIGVAISLLLYALWIAADPLILRLRGYRRMSRRESARVIPLLQEAGRRLQLHAQPTVLIADGGDRNAGTSMRHIVLGRALYDELTDDQLAAMLAHELHHWARGDSLGLRFVFVCALPLTLMYNLAMRLPRTPYFLAALAWLFLWPSWLLVKFAIQPLLAVRGRNHEYEADAAAKLAGYGPALSEALSLLTDFEGGRSGWDQVVLATHPPTELRLEALDGESR